MSRKRKGDSEQSTPNKKKTIQVPKTKAYKESSVQPFFPEDFEIVKSVVLQFTDLKKNNNK